MGLPCRIPTDGIQPILRFKVPVTRRKRNPQYFWCSIWPDIASARVRMQALGGDRCHWGYFDDVMGCCLSWQSTRVDKSVNPPTRKLLPEMGEIVLAKGWMNANIVPHECTHAAFRYRAAVEEWAIADTETPEERFCLTVGWMSSHIFKKWLAHLEREEKAATIQVGQLNN